VFDYDVQDVLTFPISFLSRKQELLSSSCKQIWLVGRAAPVWLILGGIQSRYATAY